MHPFLCERWRGVGSPVGRAVPYDGKRDANTANPSNQDAVAIEPAAGYAANDTASRRDPLALRAA